MRDLLPDNIALQERPEVLPSRAHALKEPEVREIGTLTTCVSAFTTYLVIVAEVHRIKVCVPTCAFSSGRHRNMVETGELPMMRCTDATGQVQELGGTNWTHPCILRTSSPVPIHQSPHAHSAMKQTTLQRTACWRPPNYRQRHLTPKPATGRPFSPCFPKRPTPYGSPPRASPRRVAIIYREERKTQLTLSFVATFKKCKFCSSTPLACRCVCACTQGADGVASAMHLVELREVRLLRGMQFQARMCYISVATTTRREPAPATPPPQATNPQVRPNQLRAAIEGGKAGSVHPLTNCGW